MPSAAAGSWTTRSPSWSRRKSPTAAPARYRSSEGRDLSQLPDGASVRYLAQQVVISPSRVSRVADDFVSRGLLARAASPHDGRLSLVRLTDYGRQTLADIQDTFRHALADHFLNRLTTRQITALIAIGRSLGAPHC